jgi:23S rRNA (adenine2030-N6)-methyltransferase
VLSYRHGFHVGNDADVLKHVVLVQLLLQLTKKETPLWVVDTHAGAGIYPLESGYAARNAEFGNGIGRLWARSGLPGPLARYVDEVRRVNPDGVLRYYPGSPLLALQLTRPQDRLRLFELHPNESRCSRPSSAAPAAAWRSSPATASRASGQCCPRRRAARWC